MVIKESQLLTAEFVGMMQEMLTLEVPTLLFMFGVDKTFQALMMFMEKDLLEQSDGVMERSSQEVKMDKSSFQILQMERLRKQLMLANL